MAITPIAGGPPSLYWIVECSWCGQLDTFLTQREAEYYANQMREEHKALYEKVIVKPSVPTA